MGEHVFPCIEMETKHLKRFKSFWNCSRLEWNQIFFVKEMHHWAKIDQKSKTQPKDFGNWQKEIFHNIASKQHQYLDKRRKYLLKIWKHISIFSKLKTGFSKKPSNWYLWIYFLCFLVMIIRKHQFVVWTHTYWFDHVQNIICIKEDQRYICKFGVNSNYFSQNLAFFLREKKLNGLFSQHVVSNKELFWEKQGKIWKPFRDSWLSKRSGPSIINILFFIRLESFTNAYVKG